MTPGASRAVQVLHVITRLIVGGAQENTVLSAALADRSRFRSAVAVGPETGPEGQLFDEARDRDVPVHVIPHLRRSISPHHDLLAVRQLGRLVRELRPDIVHTHSSKAGLIGRFVAHRAGIPAVVHTVHGWSFHDHMRRPVRTLYIGMERHAARWTDRLVVVTDRDREKGLDAHIGQPGRYTLIRSGFELHEYTEFPDTSAIRAELGVPLDVPVVGSVMRLSAQKDPLAFVEMASRVGRVSPAHFVIVGDGPLRGAVEQAAEVAGMKDRLHLTGLRRDVPSLLRSFDVFVLTSLWEGLPKVVIQAMAAAVPVVATDTDGVQEVVRDGENGILVPRGRPAELAAAVRALLDDEARRRRLAEAALAVVPDFDAKRMIHELERLYTTLLA